MWNEAATAQQGAEAPGWSAQLSQRPMRQLLRPWAPNGHGASRTRAGRAPDGDDGDDDGGSGGPRASTAGADGGACWSGRAGPSAPRGASPSRPAGPTVSPACDGSCRSSGCSTTTAWAWASCTAATSRAHHHAAAADRGRMRVKMSPAGVRTGLVAHPTPNRTCCRRICRSCCQRVQTAIDMRMTK